jgi:hypothetical protein
MRNIRQRSSRFSRGPIFLLAALTALLTTVFLPPSAAFAADYGDHIGGNGTVTLNPGDSLWSASGLYRLTQQGDGNLVLYSMPGNKPFWSSGTGGRNGSVTQFQSDGNLVVYATGHVAIWSTGTSGHPGSVLFMQNDANVVIRAPGNVPIWATNAQAIAGCADGSRDQAAQYAAANQFYDPVPTVSWREAPPIGPPANTLFFTIELRYNPVHRCGWALAYGSSISEVWIDRSSDGGRTWTGHLGDRSINLNQTTTYIGVYNDSYPYVIRACELGSNEIHCTAWF